MEATFQPAGSGQRLYLYHAPATGTTRGAVLYVHPWTEEMNKSRRMSALQARALAANGYAVLQIDLHGCGDSSGEFADASWHGWVDDLVMAARWLQLRHDVPLCLWGLRAGALLATQAAALLGTTCNLLLWQPATSGKALLQQFLRLKVAADMQQGAAKGTLDNLRHDLSEGRTVDVGGYGLPAALAQGLERALLELPVSVGQVAWLEVSTRQDATLLPASVACIESWRGGGRAVSAQVVKGPAFWQTQEIEDAPALIAATLAAMQTMSSTVPT